ncbi:MAG: hypothetical protein IPJ49_22225 [Candidatus Obscuribacter sp.]|nr:hypothetical protein [Candidatus Obscuribacter sp.]
MDKRLVEDLLTAVKSGQTSSAEALEQLKQLPYAELDFAKPDTLRALKFGLAEVIFAPGKSVEQIVSIAAKLRTQHKLVLATRVEPDLAQKSWTWAFKSGSPMCLTWLVPALYCLVLCPSQKTANLLPY